MSRKIGCAVTAIVPERVHCDGGASNLAKGRPNAGNPSGGPPRSLRPHRVPKRHLTETAQALPDHQGARSEGMTCDNATSTSAAQPNRGDTRVRNRGIAAFIAHLCLFHKQMACQIREQTMKNAISLCNNDLCDSVKYLRCEVLNRETFQK